MILTKPMSASLLDELGFVTDRLAHETAQIFADFVAAASDAPNGKAR